MAILTGVRWSFTVVSSVLALIHICKGLGLRSGMPGVYIVQHWEWGVRVCVCVRVCVLLVTQSRATLWDCLSCSPPGTSVHGIFQARILEWVAISSSKGIFPTQGSNPSVLHLLHGQVHSLPLYHLGSPTESGDLIKFCAFGSSFSPTSLCDACASKATFSGFWILLETWMERISQPFPHSVWLSCKFDSLGFVMSCHLLEIHVGCWFSPLSSLYFSGVVPKLSPLLYLSYVC